jgi:hypothetical protein
MIDISAVELRAALAYGRGLAHIVLEQSGDQAHRKALIAACLRDDRFMGEESHAPYLYELVRLVDAREDLAQALADPFVGIRGGDDLLQRYEMAGLLARDGVPGMRAMCSIGARSGLSTNGLPNPESRGLGLNRRST